MGFLSAPFHLSPPPHPPSTLQTPRPTTHPPSDCSTAVWTTLDRKRGLTKVSMATVQSVNHAAADVSSPSLFPFSCSFFAPPKASITPPFPLTLPAYLFFLPPLPGNFITLYLHHLLPHFCTLSSSTFLSPFSFSPRANALISRQTERGVGGGGEDIMFT